jgi:hypothetical protein
VIPVLGAKNNLNTGGGLTAVASRFARSRGGLWWWGRGVPGRWRVEGERGGFFLSCSVGYFPKFPDKKDGAE